MYCNNNKPCHLDRSQLIIFITTGKCHDKLILGKKQ